MRLLESSIEREVVKWCKDHHVLTTKLSGMGQRGKPDRVFWMPEGKAVLAEFKRPGCIVTKLQLHNIHAYAELGFDVFVFYSAAQAITVLHRYLYERMDAIHAV